MATTPTTPITIMENGDETHESWLLIRPSKVSCSPPGQRLFDSEINHQQYITVTITRCSRRRDLNRDWLHNEERLIEFAMSESQWGAFVSSFGHGSGVPATLEWIAGQGRVPSAPFEARLESSHQEVRNAGEEALREIQQATEAVMEAFEGKMGIKEMRKRLSWLQNRVDLGPGNMAYAAKSLTEHVENVVTKARADIEGMVNMAHLNAQLGRGDDPSTVSVQNLLAKPDEESES